MTEEEVRAELLGFVRENFGAADGVEIAADTPLLESGILDSLRTAVLLNHLRDGLRTPLPARFIEARYLKDVATIAALVCELAAADSR
ncbi:MULTISPECIES: phosphopantetheine-binding protein [Actinomadura]|uniref:phosphopantetheine-binding protein n=1 Tax=Actinomadura TaxID=1988 RepID=UPI00260D0667|nr:phosphopantetheine-binding protein [Actinomadura geliboluensis]